MISISKNKKYLFASGLSLVVLLGFLFLTKPSEDNFALSFAPIVMLWVLLYFSVGLFFSYLFKGTRPSIVRMARITLATSVSMLVMFSALGQLTFIDVGVLFLLASLGSFYFSRTWSK